MYVSIWTGFNSWNNDFDLQSHLCQSLSNRAKKKAVGEKIVIDAEDLLSIARELESSSNIVHINGKEYTGKKSWIANRLREIVASAPINR